MSDIYVENTQKWLNKTYKGRTGYTEIVEDGIVGWGTINALLHGLQISLGISSTANNFGQVTENAFNDYVDKNGIIQQQENETTDTVRKEINGVIQGALFCKGYSLGPTNTPTGQFLTNTGNAVKRLRSDAGINSNTTEVTLNLMKALLSMDYFYSYNNSDRVKKIITIQRYMNGKYENYIGLNPCDGIVSRKTMVSLLKAMQVEEKMTGSNVDGIFGSNSKKCLPCIPYTGSYTKNGITCGLNFLGKPYNDEDIASFKILAKIALYYNEFGDGNIHDDINTDEINKFQKNYGIPETGKVDYTTWLSLLLSCGDTSRTALACDCATIITEDNINVLIKNGYKYIGRYLAGTTVTGASKGLSKKELQLLFSKGIRVFPIYQGSANSASYFTTTNATKDATNAINYANTLKLEFGAIIYFAVDFDATDSQITNYILPYFKTLQQKFMTDSKGKYRIGIYGSRNVCSRVCGKDYACSSFISDMSTGFSGNLGYCIPNNWAFDQFHTTTISYNNKSIEIDKDGFSGKDIGIFKEYSVADEFNDDELNTTQNSFILANRGGTPIPVYASKTYAFPELPSSGTLYGTSGEKIGEIKVNDFYIFFGVAKPSQDWIHKVLFYDGKDLLMGFVTGYPFIPAIGDSVSYSNEKQILPYQEPYSCFRYNEETKDYTVVPANKEQEIYINKPVVYFNTNGNFEGFLHKGDKIYISSANIHNTGSSRPWCYRVSKIIKDGVIINENKYVSTGIEYGCSGSNRAWY